MKAAAHALVADLRNALDRAPGAVAVDFHATTPVSYAYLTARDDAAVDEISEELGLGTPKERTHEGRRWRRAEAEEGNVSITVVGPAVASDPGGMMGPSDVRGEP